MSKCTWSEIYTPEDRTKYKIGKWRNIFYHIFYHCYLDLNSLCQRKKLGELLWHTVLPNSLKLVKVGLPGDPWDGMPEAWGVPFFLIEATNCRRKNHGPGNQVMIQWRDPCDQGQRPARSCEKKDIHSIIFTHIFAVNIEIPSIMSIQLKPSQKLNRPYCSDCKVGIMPHDDLIF